MAFIFSFWRDLKSDYYKYWVGKSIFHTLGGGRDPPSPASITRRLFLMCSHREVSSLPSQIKSTNLSTVMCELLFSALFIIQTGLNNRLINLMFFFSS